MATLRDALVKSRVVTLCGAGRAQDQAEKAEREALVALRADRIRRDRVRGDRDAQCRFRDLAAQLPALFGAAVMKLHQEKPSAVPEGLVEKLVLVHRRAKAAKHLGLDPRVPLAEATFNVPGFLDMMGEIMVAQIQLASLCDLADTRPNGSSGSNGSSGPNGSSGIGLGVPGIADTSSTSGSATSPIPTPETPKLASPEAVRDAATAMMVRRGRRAQGIELDLTVHQDL